MFTYYEFTSDFDGVLRGYGYDLVMEIGPVIGGVEFGDDVAEIGGWCGWFGIFSIGWRR